MSKKKAKSLFTVLIAAVCMITMTFTFSTEESHAGGEPLMYAKATSKKAGQITLSLYWDQSFETNGDKNWSIRKVDDEWCYLRNYYTFTIYQKKGSGKYKAIKTFKKLPGKYTKKSKLPSKYTVKGLEKNVKYSYIVGCREVGSVKANREYVLKNSKATTAVTKNSTKYKNVSAIKLSAKSMTVNCGGSKKLKANLKPNSKKTLRNVTWHVDEQDIGVIKVDKNGKVTGLWEGTGYVYAVSHNGAVAKCKVTVKNPKKKKMGFTYKVTSDGIKFMPNKKNAYLSMYCEILGTDGVYYGLDDIPKRNKAGYYSDFTIKFNELKSGEKLIVRAAPFYSNKWQKYVYTKK